MYTLLKITLRTCYLQVLIVAAHSKRAISFYHVKINHSSRNLLRKIVLVHLMGSTNKA